MSDHQSSAAAQIDGPRKRVRKPPAEAKPIAPGQVYVDSAQAEDRYGLGRRTLEFWRRTHAGPPFVRVGKRVLYSLEALDRWFASQTAGGAK